MDLSRQEKDEIKIKKKLISTANKIKKNRKDPEKLKKETQQFEEIKQLLNSWESVSPCAEKEALRRESASDSLESCTIPLTAPGIDIIREENIFSLFNQETLRLKDFLYKKDGFNIFGEDSEVPNEGLFRELIAHHITEIILPDDEKCHSVSLYVLYLLSVHADKHFVSACVDFLKFRRFAVKASEILPIFVNFGAASVETLVGSNVAFGLPGRSNRRIKRKSEEKSFPYYNVEMVANVILYHANLDLVETKDLKLLITALTRLTLDRRIKYSHLLSTLSFLISALSSRLARDLDLGEVVSCLHLEGEHVLNRVEVAGVVVMPTSSSLREALIVKTINFILNSNALKISDSLKVKNVISILEELREKKLTPLLSYCILQLINISLPSVTATPKEAGDVNNLLLDLETGFFNVTDSVDLIRIKLEIAKLRCMVTKSVGQLYKMNY